MFPIRPQKYHIGEIVKISNPQSWFAELSFKEDKNRLFKIKYTSRQKYGSGGIKKYSLDHIHEDNSSSWYHEDELELVKGIDEIKEEHDLMEYKRLKAKYGQ